MTNEQLINKLLSAAVWTEHNDTSSYLMELAAQRLGAIGTLPKIWRDMVGSSPNGSYVRDCADELETAIGNYL